MKQTILNHINSNTFSYWHLEVQVNKTLEPTDLVRFISELVNDKLITKPDITPLGSYYVVSWSI